MYILLFLLHGIFIVLSHLLWYYILEGIFILFLIFFLLYFSPIFFSKKDQDFPTFSLSKISFSLQDSLILPMIFFYTAIFFLLFAVTSSFLQSFTYNTFFFIVVYVLFFLYVMAFDWKNEMFFDIARIHMIFSYTIIFSVVVLSFLSLNFISLSFLFLVLATILFSWFYFYYTDSRDILLFQGFLLSLMFGAFLFSSWFIWSVSLNFVLSSFWLSAIILFELMPRYRYFTPFIVNFVRVIYFSIENVFSKSF